MPMKKKSWAVLADNGPKKVHTCFRQGFFFSVGFCHHQTFRNPGLDSCSLLISMCWFGPLFIDRPGRICTEMLNRNKERSQRLLLLLRRQTYDWKDPRPPPIAHFHPSFREPPRRNEQALFFLPKNARHPCMGFSL